MDKSHARPKRICGKFLWGRKILIVELHKIRKTIGTILEHKDNLEKILEKLVNF